MKKTDTQSSRLQQKKDKLCQGNQWTPQEHSERRNLASNHWQFQEMLLDMVYQNVQEALKKFQDNKTQGYEKTQK
jgi:hypothetical protein